MSDEVFQTAFKEEEGKLYRILTQPTEDLILERNKQLRNNPGSLKDLEFGRQVASIPFNIWEKWRREYPELTQGDAAQRKQCILSLINGTELGRACKVQDETAKSATKYHTLQ